MAETNNLMNGSSSPVAQAVESVKTEAPVAKQAADPREEIYARKERQIRRMQRELESERTQWKTKETDYSTNYINKSRLTEDPISALTESGITVEKLTELLLNQPNSNDPTVRALRSEMKAIKDAQQRTEEAQKQAVEQQYQQAKKQITTEVKLMVDADPEFETIKSTGMQEAVVELIEQTFNAEGYLMDISEAAKAVEEHLAEEGYKLAQTRRVQSRLTPQTKTEPAVTSSKPQQRQPQVQLKTLTHRVTQEAPKRSSDKERRERALAAFYGKSQG